MLCPVEHFLKSDGYYTTITLPSLYGIISIVSTRNLFSLTESTKCAIVLLTSPAIIFVWYMHIPVGKINALTMYSFHWERTPLHCVEKQHVSRSTLQHFDPLVIEVEVNNY